MRDETRNVSDYHEGTISIPVLISEKNNKLVDAVINFTEQYSIFMKRRNVTIIPSYYSKNCFSNSILESFATIINKFCVRLRGHHFYASIVPYYGWDNMTITDLKSIMPQKEDDINNNWLFLAGQSSYISMFTGTGKNRRRKNLYLVSIIKHCSDYEFYEKDIKECSEMNFYSIFRKKKTAASEAKVFYTRPEMEDLYPIIQDLHDELMNIYIRSMLQYIHATDIIYSWNFQ